MHGYRFTNHNGLILSQRTASRHFGQATRSHNERRRGTVIHSPFLPSRSRPGEAVSQQQQLGGAGLPTLLLSTLALAYKRLSVSICKGRPPPLTTHMPDREAEALPALPVDNTRTHFHLHHTVTRPLPHTSCFNLIRISDK